MKKFLSILVSCAMLFTFIPTSLAYDSAVSDEAQKEFYITPETTIGELYRNTNPEEYAKFPEELKAILDTTLIPEANEDSRSTNQGDGLMFKDASDNIEDVDTFNNRAVNYGKLMASTNSYNKGSFAYYAYIKMTEALKFISISLTVYDTETGKAVASDLSSDYDTAYHYLSGTASSLTSGRKYRCMFMATGVPYDPSITVNPVDWVESYITVK